jgi:outer membrane protein TolC
LGIDPLRKVEIVGDLVYEPMTITLDDALKKAEVSRPEITASREELQVADEYVNAAKAEHLPKVTAFGNYRYTNAPGDFSGEEKWRDEWDAGLRLEMNLMDGRERSSRVRQRMIERENQLLLSDRLERSVTTETKNAYNEFVRAGEFVESQQKSVSFAEETFRIANERKAVGLITQMELFDIQLSLTQSRVDYYRSIYEYQMAKTNLQRAIGAGIQGNQ